MINIQGASDNLYRIRFKPSKNKGKAYIDCTANHPFWASEGKNRANRFWGRISNEGATKLKAGMFLITKRANFVEIDSIERIQGTKKVYDLVFYKPTVFYCNNFATSTCI